MYLLDDVYKIKKPDQKKTFLKFFKNCIYTYLQFLFCLSLNSFRKLNENLV